MPGLMSNFASAVRKFCYALGLCMFGRAPASAFNCGSKNEILKLKNLKLVILLQTKAVVGMRMAFL